MIPDAIILAGGLGTRLSGVIGNLPKPMAPVGGRPFLARLLDYLCAQEIRRVVLSVGYRREVIMEFFGNRYRDIAVAYAVETTPLGTGGAIRRSLDLVTSGDAFVLNGDTFLCLDYRAMLRAHRETKARLTMAVRKIPEVGRYGSVTIEDGRIVGFEEKQGGGPGLISGGTYLMSPGLFDGFKSSEAFSFESDFLRPHVAALQPCAFNVDDYFIDIGIPDDYRRAQTELAGNECRPRPL